VGVVASSEVLSFLPDLDGEMIEPEDDHGT
jgi:hypothetical protein